MWFSGFILRTGSLLSATLPYTHTHKHRYRVSGLDRIKSNFSFWIGFRTGTHETQIQTPLGLKSKSKFTVKSNRTEYPSNQIILSSLTERS